jgi:hypothetical protein
MGAEQPAAVGHECSHDKFTIFCWFFLRQKTLNKKAELDFFLGKKKLQIHVYTKLLHLFQIDCHNFGQFGIDTHVSKHVLSHLKKSYSN